MDLQRIRSEVAEAARTFALVEAYPTTEGGIYVKAGLQTSAGNTFVVAIYFQNYPHQMPKVFVTKPDLWALTPHRYTDGNICFLHPNLWNPGRHNLTFVLMRTAKWLNKYDVWRANGGVLGGKWVGASLKH
ncbi:MAG TPA: hypothetical protein VFE51_11090 [Verrucomicrobiae bacterium]|nr:hypothetical protein [Verrucomicrobiae bacterium]